MTTQTQFWDRVAPKYAASPIKDMASYEHTLERTLSHLNAGDHVLELGCGTGTTALRLAHGVARITASDISPAMIEIARGKARTESVNTVTFTAGAIETALRETPGTDAILAFNLLHLVPDLQDALTAIRGAMTPGQTFISKTPCLGGNVLIRAMVAVMRAFGRAPHVGFFNTTELETMIRKAGFDIIETGDFPKKPPAHFVVARAV